ncbi:hypothetical protein BCV69DRAFT_273442 [Microstroma glucosiphilum]|uniref:Rhodanese domain-containing protein n=1 Tax=Pseudomicrostroma glucosiphilum TaxID=1684307 RepID=A0A316U2A0_9BASI|nr:hypothetical protein BCV69DRAFT_273442 [Pseudomicrostroma glucosiphilum]PWN18553.1 hypothetical protein BCV69DRAFT_273442 [Pseudomicrostroma glucosiphilum]
MSFKPPYRYMTASSLSSILKASPATSNVPRKNIAIVDVRDDDFEGGNIVGCINVPSTQMSDERVKELVKDLRDVPTVVFHCSLSQQRGPKAARIYSEARQAALASSQVSPMTSKQSTAGDEQSGQEIYVLRDGFANFGQVYKGDATLVEKYDEEAWAWR